MSQQQQQLGQNQLPDFPLELDQPAEPGSGHTPCPVNTLIPPRPSRAHSQTGTQNSCIGIDWLGLDSHSDAGAKLLHVHGPLDFLFAERQQVQAERMTAGRKKEIPRAFTSTAHVGPPGVGVMSWFKPFGHREGMVFIVTSQVGVST